MEITGIELVHDWAYERPLLACRIDPLGRFVISSAEDRLLQKFDIPSGTIQPLALVHDSWVQALAISPSGSICISGGGDGRLVWWDCDGPETKPFRIVGAHTGWIRSVSISPDGKWLVSGGYDARVCLWDLASGQLVRTWVDHEINVYSVLLLPDSQHLVSGDLKGVVYLRDKDSESPIAKFDAAPLHSFNDGQKVNFGGVRCLAVNAEMTQLVAGGLHKSTNPLGAVHEPLALRFAMNDQSLLNSHVAEAIPGGGLWRVQFWDADSVVGVSGGSTGGFALAWKTGQDVTTLKLALPALARDFDLSADRSLMVTSHHDQHLRIHRFVSA